MRSFITKFVFIRLSKLDVGSLKILKPGGAIRLNEKRILSNLPFPIEPSKQFHFKSTYSMLFLFLGFSLKCVSAEFLVFMKPKNSFYLELKNNSCVDKIVFIVFLSCLFKTNLRSLFNVF